MTTLQTRLYNKIKATNAINSLIGGATAPRFYPVQAPERAAYPYVTYSTISRVPFDAVDAYSGRNQTRVQLDCWGQDYTSTRTLADALTANLHRWRDEATLPRITDTFAENAIDLYEDEPRIYHISLDLIFHIGEE